MNDQNLTIVVTTSFSYRELIDGFIYFFDRYWPDCPFNVLISLENEVREDYVNINLFHQILVIGRNGYLKL